MEEAVAHLVSGRFELGRGSHGLCKALKLLAHRGSLFAGGSPLCLSIKESRLLELLRSTLCVHLRQVLLLLRVVEA